MVKALPWLLLSVCTGRKWNWEVLETSILMSGTMDTNTVLFQDGSCGNCKSICWRTMNDKPLWYLLNILNLIGDNSYQIVKINIVTFSSSMQPNVVTIVMYFSKYWSWHSILQYIQFVVFLFSIHQFLYLSSVLSIYF